VRIPVFHFFGVETLGGLGLDPVGSVELRLGMDFSKVGETFGGILNGARLESGKTRAVETINKESETRQLGKFMTIDHRLLRDIDSTCTLG
jgi:hypothetical protein